MKEAIPGDGEIDPREELELVQRALDGDREAFDRIMENAAPALFRFASSRLAGDRESAREVVQTTLVKVVENLESFRGESRLLTWMCGICRFEILALYRQRRRDAAHQEVDEAVPRVREALRDSLGRDERDDDPSAGVERSERAALVHLALDHLPEHYARALEWKYLERRPVQEIADRLEVGLKAAESILTRARAAFRDAYERLSREPSLDPDGGVGGGR